VSALGLLPGVQRFAPDSSSLVRAAPAPAQEAAQATSGAPTRSALDGAAPFDPASDEQLDIAAALDQGARLFILHARYHDWGGGQDDYYLAGPTQVSHQPLSALFAPLATWLAAPEHDKQGVVLALATDPRSANPARFDAACQAFQDRLGQYVLKSSELPAGKGLGELTPDEMAALQSQPRVYTDWSECTGDQLPVAQAPAVAVAASEQSYERWMADLSDTIGQRPLKQVIIPGSHDAGTFGNFADAFTQAFAHAQSVDLATQLTAGSRYFDLRAGYKDWGGQAGPDYWNSHGAGFSTDARLSQLLDSVVTWTNQPGHEKEIVVLSISADPAGNEARLRTICQDNFLTPAGNRLLQPNMVPAGGGVWDLSLNEIWALPNHPTIITNWDWCTGQGWPFAGGQTLVDSFYANQCYANQYPDNEGLGESQPGTMQTLTTALPGRQSAEDNPANSNSLSIPGPFPELPGQRVGGLYVLFTQSTPVLGCLLATAFGGLNSPDFYHASVATQEAVQGWYTDNQYNAQANLNVIAGDFVQWRGIVDIAVALNKLAVGPRLQTGSGNPLPVSCTSPKQSAVQMVAYPVQEGPSSPHLQSWQGGGPVNLPRTQFPPGDYDVRVVCETADGLISSLTIPTSALGAVIALSLREAEDRPHDLRTQVDCHPIESVSQPLTLSIFPSAQPNSPDRLNATSGPDGTIQYPVRRGQFSPGGDPVYGYELTATCGSSDTPPWTATITFRTSDLTQNVVGITPATPGSLTPAVGQPPAAMPAATPTRATTAVTPTPGSTPGRTPTPGSTVIHTPTAGVVSPAPTAAR
jgi:hypothetical protein